MFYKAFHYLSKKKKKKFSYAYNQVRLFFFLKQGKYFNRANKMVPKSFFKVYTLLDAFKSSYIDPLNAVLFNYNN
jgi:hypothetical protein